MPVMANRLLKVVFFIEGHPVLDIRRRWKTILLIRKRRPHMGETTDYSTYFTEEIQAFAKDAVFKDAR